MADKPLLPFSGDDEHLRRILAMIGYMVIVAGFAVALVMLLPVARWIFGLVSPFLVALVVAYLFNPIVNFFQYRLRVSRIYGVILVSLLVVLLVAGFIAIVVPILVSQVRSASGEIREFMRERATPWVVDQIGVMELPSADFGLVVARAMDEWYPENEMIPVEDLVARVRELADAPKDDEFLWGAEANMLASELEIALTKEEIEAVERDRMQELLSDPSAEWYEEAGSRRLARRFEEWMNSQGLTVEGLFQSAAGSEGFRSAAQSAASGGAGVLGWVVESLVATIRWLLSSLVFLSFVVVLAFFLLIDFASLRGAMEVVCPAKWRQRFFDLLHKLDIAVGGFIRGQMLVALIVGCLTTLGLFFLGMKQYAVLIGLIAGVANMVPFFGPVIGGAPAVMYVLLSDTYSEDRLLYLALTVGWFVLIQSLESMFLQPYIVGQSARLHPVIVILSVAIGAQFGLMGALLAVPITSMLRVILKEFYWDERVEAWRRDTGKKRLDERPRRARGKKRRQRREEMSNPTKEE